MGRLISHQTDDGKQQTSTTLHFFPTNFGDDDDGWTSRQATFSARHHT